MTALKLTKIGNSVGVVLPKEMLAQHNLDQGDVLYVTRTESGWTLSVFDESLANQVEALRKVMKKRRSALRELAK